MTADQTVERTVIAYLTIKGQGVYRSVNLNSNFPSFTKMLGGGGRPTVNSGAVGAGAPVRDPNGAYGKIALASPAFVPGDPLANTYYQSWLYAAVSKANGDFDGLYVTKDAGTNWTKVRLMSDTAEPLFTHNSSTGPGGGNHSLAVAVDPTNPNIVYLGSDQIVRVDTTFINDPYNLSLYQYSNPDGGLTRELTTGGAQVDDRLMDDGINNNSTAPPDDTNSGLRSDDPVRGNRNPFDPPFDSMTPLTYARELEGEFRRGNRFLWNHLNLDRDPYQPFFRDTTLTTFNVAKFTNTGEERQVLRGGRRRPRLHLDLQHHDRPGPADREGPDPVRARQRDRHVRPERRRRGEHRAGSSSRTSRWPAWGPRPHCPARPRRRPGNLQVNGSRNGDIQVARLYDGDVHPSLLAANIANAFLYGAGRRLQDLAGSPENELSTGNANWYNPLGSPFPGSPRPMGC